MEHIELTDSPLTEEDYTAMKKKLMAEAAGMISGRFKKVFDEHPEVLGVTWTQYTPYFCDGDPCEFGVNDLYLILNKEGQLAEGIDEDDIEEEFDEENVEEFYEGHVGYRSISPLKDVQTELNTFANNCEELFKAAFGDHASVVVSRKGFFINEYDHE